MMRIQRRSLVALCTAVLRMRLLSFLTHIPILLYLIVYLILYLILSTVHSGPNIGTSQAKNKIVIFQKPTGGPNDYGESTKISELTVGQSYQIDNYRNSQYDVIITYDQRTSDLRDAKIIVRTIDLLTPVIACNGNKGQFTLKITTDSYGSETSWTLKEKSNNNNVISSVPSNFFASDTEYIIDYNTAGYEDSFCLKLGSEYTLEFYDTYGGKIIVDGVQWIFSL
jgi:hypothetical protein